MNSFGQHLRALGMRAMGCLGACIAVTAMVTACGSSTSPSSAGAAQNTAPASAAAATTASGGGAGLDVCRLFTQADAAAILHTPVQAGPRNTSLRCAYLAAPAPSGASTSLSVIVTPGKGATVRQSAQALHLTTPVSGVGDVAFTDGRATILAQKGDTQIQVVFVSVSAGDGDPITVMTAAGKKVADAL